MTGRGFAAVPSWLVEDESISGHAKITYLVLMSHHSEGGDVFPSHARIATLAGISVSSVQRALRELRDLGVVDWEQGDAKHGGRGSNSYLIRTTRPRRKAVTLGQGDRPPRSGGPTPSVRVTDELEPENKNQRTSDAGASPLFEVEGVKRTKTPAGLDPKIEDTAVQIAELFAENLLEIRVDSTARKTIERLLTKPKVSVEELVQVATYATTDSFWKPKVRSFALLARHFDSLRLQVSTSGPRATAATPAAPPVGAHPLVGDDDRTVWERSRVFLSRGISPSRYWAPSVDEEALVRRVIAAPVVRRDFDELASAWANRDSGGWPVAGWVEQRL